ncbi:MAG: hypothetical protein ACI4MI_02550 [Christensenellales bacterium]
MDKQSRNLIKKCNSGAKIALNTLEYLLQYIQREQMKVSVSDLAVRHRNYIDESNSVLLSQQIKPDNPSPFIRKMAHGITKMRLKKDAGDKHIAIMIIQGADKGIKQLNAQIAKNSDASEQAKKLSDKLITLQQDTIKSLKIFL